MSQENYPFASVGETDYSSPLSPEKEQATWIVFGVLLAVLTFGYWNMLTYTSNSWSNDLYSHGWIVPLFTGYLFWIRRQRLTNVPLLERWIGLGILAVFLVLRLYGSYNDKDWLDRLTYIGALLGIVQMVGGTKMLRWAGPAAAFLLFMFPLPSKIEHTVLLNLQRVAAIASTWTLQALGAPALRDGSRIVIDQLPLDVADACSGLRMGTIFGAMSVALALIIDRPWWDRLTILVMAIPVALVTNIIRITATALLYMSFPESEAIKHYVHDWAGLAMMPIAMGFLWLELQILSRITVPIETDDYAAFGTAHG